MQNKGAQTKVSAVESERRPPPRRRGARSAGFLPHSLSPPPHLGPPLSHPPCSATTRDQDAFSHTKKNLSRFGEGAAAGRLGGTAQLRCSCLGMPLPALVPSLLKFASLCLLVQPLDA